MYNYRIGIDVSSTSVKAVVLDEKGKIIFSQYDRHHAQTQLTLLTIMKEAREALGPCRLHCAMTGSGGMGLSKALGIDFVQEVEAVALALKHEAPQTDVAIELGGEDAKIIYFADGLEERMNGVCAGGTGSFIDQMAALMQTDAQGLNAEAAQYREIYPIAARCGVFAKSDIPPLINDGASKADLAASVFQAVVNQTVSGLACGKPIRGNVAFLGGPLHFLPELRASFIRTLGLTDETAIMPEDSHLFAAMGAALKAKRTQALEIDSLIDALNRGVLLPIALSRLEPLFSDHTAYREFANRHAQAKVKRSDLSVYSGPCYLGIDAGSTTTKLALIGIDGELLWNYYANNQGSPLNTAITALTALMDQLPAAAFIARACSTGYGEELMKSAFHLDEGEVETIAHVTAARFFDAEVDCVLDIGGQDMKYIKLKNGSVDTILLNEACSSGCGSFLENFAVSMGYTAQGFAAEALFASHPLDLGTRWTEKYTSAWGVSGLRAFCQPAINALARSKRFAPPMHIDRIADLAKPVLSIGNQYGEGWLLCGEMAELLEQGVHNIVCIQPFGCLPNHVVGKGVIKQLKRKYPKANIAAVDYDPGASEVNQMNRIKLMLSQACVKQM